MAEKVSTLIIELATHECNKCYDKIQKVVCKLQDKEKISNVNFDTRKNTVTISGSFDTTRLWYKLWHKAGKAIKSIEIAADEKKEESEKTPDDEKKKKKKKKKKKNPAEPKPETREWRLMICRLCHPLRCNDPSHYYQQQQHYGCPTPQRPSNCGGPSYCGGACGGSSCTGAAGGWPPAMQMMQQRPAAIGCPGGGCKGCNGCRIVQEGRFIYEEYPPSGAASCAIM